MILIAFGGNLPYAGNAPHETFRLASSVLAKEGVRVTAFSSVWESPPWPEGAQQPWYENAVASVETALDPQDLLRLLHVVEASFGRNREGELRNAPRSLDLDLVAYNELVLDEGGLELPHPRMGERSFVLYPLCEIAPDWVHPISHRSALELRGQLRGQLPKSTIISLKQKSAA